MAMSKFASILDTVVILRAILLDPCLVGYVLLSLSSVFHQLLIACGNASGATHIAAVSQQTTDIRVTLMVALTPRQPRQVDSH